MKRQYLAISRQAANIGCNNYDCIYRIKNEGTPSAEIEKPWIDKQDMQWMMEEEWPGSGRTGPTT